MRSSCGSSISSAQGRLLWFSGGSALWVHMGVRPPPLYFSRAYIGRVHRSQMYRLMNSHMCSTQMKMQRMSFIPEGSLMPWVTSLSLLAPSLSLACPRYDRWYHLVCPFRVWLLSLILRSGARSVMLTCSSLSALAFCQCSPGRGHGTQL